MRYFRQIVKVLMLASGLGIALVHFSASGNAAALTQSQEILSGTVIGNAKFVEYSNEIYGFKLMYPEQWNLVDSGQSVNIVAYQPEGFTVNSSGGPEFGR